MVQFWMSPHPPKRGIPLLGTCPKVHTGFHKAWTARGLHTQVIQYLQVQLCLHLAPILQQGSNLCIGVCLLAALSILCTACCKEPSTRLPSLW